MVTQDLEQRPILPSRVPAIVVLAFAVAALVALAGYAFGASRSSDRAMTGVAHIGDHMASIEADGWFYGLSDSVAWLDASGSFHENGWPDCLRPAGATKTVRFGAARVTTPEVAGFRPVVWVDCRVG